MRHYIESKSPKLAAVMRKARGLLLRTLPPQTIFTLIYRNKVWKDSESISGSGSNMRATESIRGEIPRLIESLEIKSMLDVPCGDFHWMKEVPLDGVEYIGGDIVEDLAKDNQVRYGGSGRSFVHLDILKGSIPEVDLIFCRDCLVHFSSRHIRDAVANFKASGAKYLAATTFPEMYDNREIPTGQHRPINLMAPPFSFPEPLLVLDDSTGPPGAPFCKFKRIGVWRIADLPSGSR